MLIAVPMIIGRSCRQHILHSENWDLMFLLLLLLTVTKQSATRTLHDGDTEKIISAETNSCFIASDDVHDGRTNLAASEADPSLL